MSKSAAQQWLDTAAAAEYLGTTVLGIRGMVRRGRLVPGRMGRKLMFRVSDLDACVRYSHGEDEVPGGVAPGQGALPRALGTARPENGQAEGPTQADQGSERGGRGAGKAAAHRGRGRHAAGSPHAGLEAKPSEITEAFTEALDRIAALERELAETRAERDALRAKVEWMRAVEESQRGLR